MNNIDEGTGMLRTSTIELGDSKVPINKPRRSV
jgi:hypothetical protein